MKKLLTLVFTIVMVNLYAQVNITFQVDMSGETVSADGVHIAGSLNGWNTTANMLTHQGSNIYAVTLSLAANTSYEFKYLNGNNWGTEEAPPATCTINGNNRFFTTPANDVILDVVPFNGCAPTQNITFQVDMTGHTVSANGVHIAGEFNNWNPSATMLTHQGGNIYSVTIGLIPHDDYEYKYLNGDAWGTEESAPAVCTVNGNNRISSVSNTDAILAVVPFNGCPVNPTQDVTFYVDMNGQTVSADGVHVTGNFNGWNTGSASMTDLGNGVYTITTPVISSITTVQYKYLNGNAWGTEEDVPPACENINENRELTIEGLGSSIDFPVFEFGTCTETAVPVELTFFKGEIIGNTIELTWQTASEEQNEGFQIEKSIDGKRWETIDFVAGYGTTYEVQDYQYLDENPVANTNYYRLKQIDFDGGFEYSNVVTVDYKMDFNNNLIQVFPNPVEDKLNITNAEGQLILYNAIGQPLKQLNITAATFQLNTNDLQRGTYLLVINKNDGSTWSKVIIK